MRDFAVAHAYVPVGARLWTFGSSRYADPDGWTALAGATLTSGACYLDVTPRTGEVVLVSPAQLSLTRGETDLLILGADTATVETVAVEARTPAGAWIPLAPRRASSQLTTTTAGLSVPLAWPTALVVADQVRVSLRFRDAANPVRIRLIALLPPATAQAER